MSTEAVKLDAAALDGAAPHIGQRVHVIEPWKPGVRTRLEELWRYRRLVTFMGKRFLERRYRNTWLGWVWIPLKPVLDIVSKALLFGGFLSVSSGDRPYIIFFTFGSCGWIVFNSVNHWAVRGMRMSANFVRDAHAPWLVRLAGVTFPAALDFLLYVGIAVIALFYYLFARGVFYLVPSLQLLTAGLGIVMLFLFGFGIGLLTSPLSMYARDIRYSFTYVMQFWYYISPVAYPISQMPAKYQPIALYNPLTAPLEMVKYGFLSTAPPRQESLVISIVVLLAILIGGLWTFNRFERAAIERL